MDFILADSYKVSSISLFFLLSTSHLPSFATTNQSSITHTYKMLSYSATTLLSLLAFSSLSTAFPLQRRLNDTSTPAVCRPSFPAGSVRQIRSDSDTRAGWVRTPQDGFDSVVVRDFGTMDPLPEGSQWIVEISDQARLTYTITSANDTSSCLAGSGGPVQSASCSDSTDLIQWFITCDTCVEAGGGDNCEVQSVEEGQCANNSQETLTLEDCDNRALIFSAQYFHF